GALLSDCAPFAPPPSPPCPLRLRPPKKPPLAGRSTPFCFKHAMYGCISAGTPWVVAPFVDAALVEPPAAVVPGLDAALPVAAAVEPPPPHPASATSDSNARGTRRRVLFCSLTQAMSQVGLGIT